MDIVVLRKGKKMYKRKRKGRSINHYWKFVKYKGDGAFYARCGCGFRYACFKHDPPNTLRSVPAPEKLYNYCPCCGARKKWYYEKPMKIDRYWFE